MNPKQEFFIKVENNIQKFLIEMKEKHPDIHFDEEFKNNVLDRIVSR